MTPQSYSRSVRTGSAQAGDVSASASPSARMLQPVEPVRLTLLAAILYNPLVLIGYLLYLYGPSQRCVAGPLCQFGSYPGYLQLALVLVGAWLLWLLLNVGVRRVLEAPGWQGWLPSTLRALSAYESVRELLGVLGVVLMICLVIALLGGHLTPTVLILGVFTAGVSIRAAFVRDDPALTAAEPAMPARRVIASAAMPHAGSPGSSAFASSGAYRAATPTPLGSSMPFRTAPSSAAAAPSGTAVVGESATFDVASPFDELASAAGPTPFAERHFGAPFADEAPYGDPASGAPTGPFGVRAPDAQSLPFDGTAPGAAPEPSGYMPPGYAPPPAFLPTPELLSPNETTLPPGWQGQDV